ncbi:mitochondrial 54S ribosomal protein rml2 [Cystobasidiomycetes sp. EMM_F5]
MPAARVPLNIRSDAATTTSKAGGSAESTSGTATVFRTFQPLTPGLRHVRQVVHSHLHKGKPYRPLTVAKRATGGRDNTGHIATRFRGGGHKRRIRLVDFRRQTEGEQIVERIEYDPGRSAHIALIKHSETQDFSYILAPDGLRAGDKVQSWPKGVPKTNSSSGSLPISTDPNAPQTVTNPVTNSDQPESLTMSLLRATMVRTGNQLPLHLVPVGTTIHCISTRPNGKASLCRSAGTSGKVIAATAAGSKGDTYAQVQLQSGEVRKLHHQCTAVIGSVSNRDHQNEVIGKAGRNRWLGRKPRVRGVAMNATDHPHGGGRGKSKGGKHPRTPQGIKTKGKRTRRPGPRGNTMVIRQRPRGAEKSRG